MPGRRMLYNDRLCRKSPPGSSAPRMLKVIPGRRRLRRDRLAAVNHVCRKWLPGSSAVIRTQITAWAAGRDPKNRKLPPDDSNIGRNKWLPISSDHVCQKWPKTNECLAVGVQGCHICSYVPPDGSNKGRNKWLPANGRCKDGQKWPNGSDTVALLSESY